MINFFITELRNNIIMMVVHSLFKIAYFVPLRFSKGEAHIIMVAKL